jgi:hypothetical protein
VRAVKGTMFFGKTMTATEVKKEAISIDPTHFSGLKEIHKKQFSKHG